MQYSQAHKIAIATCYKLQPFCKENRLNIAGSIRRKSPEVKDIEIICLPKMESQKDLFGNASKTIRSNEFITAVNKSGTIIKGKPTGKYMQIALPEGINLDLFMPDEDDYFRQYAVRTGSAEYAHKVLANAWRKMGWCGSDQGLRKVSDCYETSLPDGKIKWTCINKNAEKPPVWQSEEEFFQWLWIPFVKPEKRYV